MKHFDPRVLASWQDRLDRASTRRFPWLLAIKQAKMRVSAHAFLRGSAPLFHRLASELKLGALGEREGWIVGDMHVENVGAYRTDDDVVVFDLNDFDAATKGPLAFDVLRLLTSILLTARGAALDAVTAIDLAKTALAAWSASAATGRVPRAGAAIDAICHAAEASTFAAYLDARAPVVKGERAFERGERYRSLVAPWTKHAPVLLARYVALLDKKRSVTLVDAAHRIAGTGSLGCVRIACVVLIGDDTYRLYELKEASDAAQVVAGARALVSATPRGLLALPRKVGGAEFIARRLEPQQQKLNLLRLARADFEPTFIHIAGLLGRAHRRSSGRVRLSAGETKGLLSHAIQLAGQHEAIYLAYAAQLAK